LQPPTAVAAATSTTPVPGSSSLIPIVQLPVVSETPERTASGGTNGGGGGGGGGGGPDIKVKVTLLSTTLSSADADKLVQHYKNQLSQLPGFQQFKYSLLPGLVAGFTFFETEDQHKNGLVYLQNYLHNANGVHNLFDTNLIDNGTLVLLTVCSSW
jgi:hypothetical protein